MYYTVVVVLLLVYVSILHIVYTLRISSIRYNIALDKEQCVKHMGLVTSYRTALHHALCMFWSPMYFII